MENEKQLDKKTLNISILGDSLSTFEGYSVPNEGVHYKLDQKIASGVVRVSDTWWGQVIDGLGGKLLVNHSIAGSTVCGGPQYLYPSYGCSDERTAALGDGEVRPDIILVYIGTNDWGRGIPLRPEGSNDEGYDPTRYFRSAYDLMLKKLRKNYPQAEIFCFTLARSCFLSEPQFAFPYARSGIHIEEYCAAIREIAAANGCRLVDLYTAAEPYDTFDGYHANVVGMATIARAALGQMKR